MTVPRCAFLSFRLGGSDGVSIVAREWRRQFESLGWETVTIAGEGPVDRIVDGLAIGAGAPPTLEAVGAAIDDVDLVVVENLLTIPLNLPASRIVAQALRGRPALLHHHDPPWQRARFEHITELPPTDPAWRHVTINQLTARQFADRGIDAITIYNSFDTEIDLSDQPRWRAAQRARLAVADDELLIVHPVRAIERKNVPAALGLAQAAGATFWLTGPAEEDYAPVLAALIESSCTRVIHEPAIDLPSLYAAADLVVFPSLWEGFGNPPVEAAIHRRPVIVGSYPVAAEQRALGFDWPEFDWPDFGRPGHTPQRDDSLIQFARNELESPDLARIDHNRHVATKKLGWWAGRDQLELLLEKAGWQP